MLFSVHGLDFNLDRRQRLPLVMHKQMLVGDWALHFAHAVIKRKLLVGMPCVKFDFGACLLVGCLLQELGKNLIFLIGKFDLSYCFHSLNSWRLAQSVSRLEF